MTVDALRPNRKPNRLSDYDYSQPGCYFITVCTKNREHLFWNDTPVCGDAPPVGADIIRPRPPILSRYGQIAEAAILEIPQHYPNANVEKYVIMPNHIHFMLTLCTPKDGRMISAPTKDLSTIIGQMKRAATKRAGIELWQKGYHDHVVRTSADYLRVWDYIDVNPAKWREDCYYNETEESPMPKEEKTNVMRLLEQKNIPYTAHAYEHEEGVAVDGVTVAQSLGQDVDTVFKTLVARGASKEIYVFAIPVAENLDLKKAAKAVGEKSIEMIHVKEITPLTGYVRGGCSPVGMRKGYPTVFHETAEILDTIMVSAGKIGYQVELAPAALMELVGATTADLTI